jgi:hypothetical protein
VLSFLRLKRRVAWPKGDEIMSSGKPESQSDTLTTPDTDPALTGSGSLSHTLATYTAFAAALGAIQGAIVETVPGAREGAVLGALFLGAVGLLAGVRYSSALGQAWATYAGAVAGATFGLVAGSLAGWVAGAMVVAFVGTLLGSMVLSGIREVLQTLGYRLGNPAVWLIVGAGLGGMGWALWNDQERALTGAATGMLAGAAVGFFLSLGFVVVLVLLMRDQPE